MRPTAITADREKRQIMITWSDGHESAYPFALVRYACPCAECRGGHDKMGSTPDPEVFNFPDDVSPRTQMKNLEAVGTYALTIEWHDGHHYGIYNWNFLRALCPCPACRMENGDG